MPSLAPTVWQPTAASEPSKVELGLISNARRRQRRRYLAVVSALLIVGLAGSLMAFRHDGSSRPYAGGEGPLRPITRHEPASAAFAQAPYMGVACHVPNRISCDRVGLAVWLRRPARVTALIEGKRVMLDNPTWSYVARPGHLYVYAGFLQPAGLTSSLGVIPSSRSSNSWFGANAPSPLVRFQIDYGSGAMVSTQQHVYLSAGWG